MSSAALTFILPNFKPVDHIVRAAVLSHFRQHGFHSTIELYPEKTDTRFRTSELIFLSMTLDELYEDVTSMSAEQKASSLRERIASPLPQSLLNLTVSRMEDNHPLHYYRNFFNTLDEVCCDLFGNRVDYGDVLLHLFGVREIPEGGFPDAYVDTFGF